MIEWIAGWIAVGFSCMAGAGALAYLGIMIGNLILKWIHGDDK